MGISLSKMLNTDQDPQTVRQQVNHLSNISTNVQAPAVEIPERAEEP